MSERSGRADDVHPLAGTWAESFLTPSEARVLRRRFGFVEDDEAIELPGRVPPEDGSGGSSAPAAPPVPPGRRADG